MGVVVSEGMWRDEDSRDGLWSTAHVGSLWEKWDVGLPADIGV